MSRIDKPTRRWFDIFVEDFKTSIGTILTFGNIQDGEYLKRSGNTITSDGGGGGGGQTNTVTGSNGITNTGDNVDADLEPTYGSAANTICEGDDARLSDARTPIAHDTSHENGGGDEISVAGLSGVLADNQNAIPAAGIDTSAIHTADAAGGDLGGTYPNPSVTDDSHNHTVATLPATMPPSAHAIDGAAHTGNLSAEDILVDKIGAATYDDVKNYLAGTQASGIISGGTMTDLGGFVLQVAAGTGMIRASNSGTADVLFFDWSQDNDVKTSGGAALTADATNYVYVDYNGGSPVVYSETTKTAQGRDKFYLGKVFPEGTELHIIQAGQNITELAKRVQARFTGVDGEIVRASGSVIAETGQRYITSTAGVQYAGLTRNTTLAQDTSGADHFEYYSYIAGSWTEVDATQTTNSQYNDVSVPGAEVLANLTSNRYAVDWVYVDHDGHLMVVYGQGDYTLFNAEQAQPPSSLPDHIADFGFLAAKVITQEGETNWYGVESAYDTAFTPSGAAIHNELSALQGGTSDEYYHLTSAEHSAILLDGDAAGGSLGGTYPNPSVTPAAGLDTTAVHGGDASPDIRALRETSGPQILTMGAVADGEYLTRSGNTIIGSTPGGSGGITLRDLHAEWITDAAAGGGGIWDFLVDGTPAPSGLAFFSGGAGLTVNVARILANGDISLDISTVAPGCWAGFIAYSTGLIPPCLHPMISCKWTENLTLVSGVFTNATNRFYIRDADSPDVNKDMIGMDINDTGLFRVVRNTNELAADTYTTGDTTSPWRGSTNRMYLRLIPDRLMTGCDVNVASGRPFGRAKFVPSGNGSVFFERESFSITDRLSYTWQIAQNGTSNITKLISAAEIVEYKA